MSYYCKSTKHKFELVFQNSKFVWACKNCRCHKINHDKTKRYNKDIKMFGIESANYMHSVTDRIPIRRISKCLKNTTI